jgi:hypothetical protein
MDDFIQCFRVAKKTNMILVYDHRITMFDVLPIDSISITLRPNEIEIIKNFKN